MSDIYGRFKPLHWWWKQRFSFDELKEVYSKLFKCNWFNEMRGSFTFERPYEVGRNGLHAEVLLKDGGSTRLEYVEPQQLDWLLFNGWKFGFNLWRKNKELYANPLYQKESREEALIVLNLAGFSLNAKKTQESQIIGSTLNINEEVFLNQFHFFSLQQLKNEILY